MIEVNNSIMIDFIVVAIIIMLRQSLSESAGHFWQAENSKMWQIQISKNLKHLQNPGHLPLTLPNKTTQLTSHQFYPVQEFQVYILTSTIVTYVP